MTRRVHADHPIRAIDNQKMSVDPGNSFVEGSCLQEFQSVPGPVGVQNQESALPRTDERVVKVELCHQCRVTITPRQSLVHLLLKKPKLKATRK